MMVEVIADESGSVSEVLSIILKDAIGAFTGELANKQVVNRATLTGPVLAGLAWTVILVLPICVAIVLALVKEPPPVANESVPIKEGITCGGTAQCAVC